MLEDLRATKIVIGAMAGNPDLKRLVFDQIRLAANATVAQIFSQDLDLREGDCELDIGSDPESIERFRRDVATRNILFTPRRSKLFRLGAVLLSHEVVPDAEMEDSELYQMVLRPMFFLMALPMINDGASVKGFGLQRERDRGPFGEAERRILQELGPCLVQAEQDEQAGRIASLVSNAKSEIFYLQNHAVLLVDQEGRVLGISRAAEQFVQRAHGLLSSRLGRTQIASTSERQKILIELIRTVASTGVAQSTKLQREGASTVAVELRRVDGATTSMISTSQVVALYLTDESEVPTLLSQSMNLHMIKDFDGVEQRIVYAMVTSKTPNKQIAVNMGLNFRAFEKRVQRIADKLNIKVPRGGRVRPILVRVLTNK